MENTNYTFTDEQIVTLLKNKDIRGIDALYHKYGECFYGVVFNIVKNDHYAETVLQNTCLKIWDNIDSFSFEKGRFFSWAINIARNTAIDMMRSKYYKQSLLLVNLDQIPQQSTSKEGTINLDKIDLKNLVAKLDVRYRELIELIYFKGYTHMEIAEELGLPLGTVKSRIRRAFKELRNTLNE